MSSLHTSTDKTTRHRERMKAAGLRPVQFWVPDTRSPEFVAQVRHQCLKLNNDPTEADILQFTEESAAQMDGWV
ncbi:antitoxin MazE family protein [Acidithiobacillus sp. HP-6]|uniref:antitoxin MazE family protein n=1 Tax=unclassified Acidithiobacillus TaxID=2614800 RepID=UPI001879DD67|nr:MULTISPECIES: antitoxin MazE family protein [unclassified Acidithiobacillus]MBE7563716.1 antitoxin MazE family protein [Acidithiobacillus sp. HP-6]MBE7569485.1 antitoxin MazE family protein [Acidithiobacillus sp. HP-2]